MPDSDVHDDTAENVDSPNSNEACYCSGNYIDFYVVLPSFMRP